MLGACLLTESKCTKYNKCTKYKISIPQTRWIKNRITTFEFVGMMIIKTCSTHRTQDQLRVWWIAKQHHGPDSAATKRSVKAIVEPEA